MGRAGDLGPAEALSIALEDGTAEAIGDGMFVIVQQAPEGEQRVALSADDLRLILAAA